MTDQPPPAPPPAPPAAPASDGAAPPVFLPEPGRDPESEARPGAGSGRVEPDAATAGQMGAQSDSVPAGWEGIFEPGEVQLWQDQPVAGSGRPDLTSPKFRAAAIPLLVGIGWVCVVLAFVEPLLIKLFMALFGLPFILGGWYNSFGETARNARLAAQTWYTLSNRALYIASQEKGKRVLNRYPLDRLDMQPVLEDGEPGNIWFAEKDSGILIRSSSGPAHNRLRQIRQIREPVGFRRISRPRHVYGLLLRALAERRGEAGPPPV